MCKRLWWSNKKFKYTSIKINEKYQNITQLSFFYQVKCFFLEKYTIRKSILW